MSFQCAHRGFEAAVNDPNYGYLGRGNVMSNTQSSTYVRGFHQTSCNGFAFEPGRLRDFDLDFFSRDAPACVRAAAHRLTDKNGIIVYRFFHWRGRVRITHGWLITNTDHGFLNAFVTGPTWKSRDVLAKARDAIVSSA